MKQLIFFCLKTLINKFLDLYVTQDEFEVILILCTKKKLNLYKDSESLSSANAT